MKPLFQDIDMTKPEHVIMAAICGGFGLVLGVTVGSQSLTVALTVIAGCVIAFIAAHMITPKIKEKPGRI